MGIALFLLALVALTSAEIKNSQLEVFTVATNETDGYSRFMRSADYCGVPINVLGMNTKWEGGNMQTRGGGHKVNLFLKALEGLKNTDKIVLFTDSYDVIYLNGIDYIYKKFLEMDTRLLFSAEIYCWPDEKLEPQYPSTDSSYKYLNSGAFIGYARDVYEILSMYKIKNYEDDQLYYTNIFLNKNLRKKYKIKLDYKSIIFQNLFGAEKDLNLNTENKDGLGSFLENSITNTKPAILHGNGPSKVFLNSLSNYLPGAWDSKNGCTICPVYTKTDPGKVVLLSIFINIETPFMEEFFYRIGNLSYPKNKMHLIIYNNVKTHEAIVNSWTKDNGYLSVKRILPSDSVKEPDAHELAMSYCLKKKCDYLFSVDSLAHLDAVESIERLINANKQVIAPMLIRPYKAWSNFWGALSSEGFYARSFDYMDIVNNEKRGIWNVPYITHSYLINGALLPKLIGIYKEDKMDPDMAFAKKLRDMGVFMYVDNRIDMGHLIDPDTYNPSLKNPEIYQVLQNQYDWEQRYLHVNYSLSLKPDAKHLQPCPDVFWFPLVTERFSVELIEIMENFGKWSAGSNKDERLLGGYENVPTRDIHMNQVGLERQWLFILQEYVRPLQEKVFLGYFNDPPKSLMNFVVRYKPDEQPSLRPHHDASTYTINLALNRPNIDYTGGGCHFLRYNCSVTNTKMGWVLMHPGRLTHFHEGLKVISGTRYIMISFIDP